MATTPEQYRSKNHKDIVLPSGAEFTIRKLTQRDFFPVGLMALALEQGQVSPEESKKWLRENPQSIEEMEERQLIRGVVAPRLTSDIDDNARLYMYDLDPQDRSALLQEIQDFSGLSKEKQETVSSFRQEVLDGSGTDGEALP